MTNKNCIWPLFILPSCRILIVLIRLAKDPLFIGLILPVAVSLEHTSVRYISCNITRLVRTGSLESSEWLAKNYFNIL